MPPLNPILWLIPGLNIAIRWYGVFIALGGSLGALVAIHQARRKGEDGEEVWNILIYALIFGIIGARLYHLFSSPAGTGGGFRYYFYEDPFEDIRIFRWSLPFPTALMVWRGGLGIYGGIAGGVLGGWLYIRRNGLNFKRWLDIAAPGIILAQAIGRWGNFVNQELYGPPTNLPWGILIDAAHRINPYENLALYPLDTRFHPDFLYESLWNLLGFGFLLWLSRFGRFKLNDGDIFLSYLIYYPLGRLLLENLRPDAWRVGNIPVAQVISLVLIIMSAGLLLRQHWRQKMR